MADVIQFKLARNTRTGKTQRIPPSIWGNQTRMRTRNWVLVEAPPEDQHNDPVSVNIPSLNGTARPVIEMPTEPPATDPNENPDIPAPDFPLEGTAPAPKRNPKSRK